MSTLIWVLIIATPLSRFWFATVSALPENLVILAQTGIWITLPIPALGVLQSWFQGSILHSHKTRGITEAVLIYLFTNIITLLTGVWYGKIAGLYVGLSSFVISTVVQTGWLWFRSRQAIQAVHQRDEVDVIIPTAEMYS